MTSNLSFEMINEKEKKGKTRKNIYFSLSNDQENVTHSYNRTIKLYKIAQSNMNNFNCSLYMSF